MQMVKDTKPDLDNLLKSLQDALTGVLWKDDALIFSYGAGTGKYYTDGQSYIEFTIDEYP